MAHVYGHDCCPVQRREKRVRQEKGRNRNPNTQTNHSRLMPNKPLLALLFSEDSVHDLELVQRKLQDIAIVRGAGSRVEFLKALKEPVDVILIDFHLVDLDGAEAISLARVAKPNTPILIVTGSIDDLSAAAACQYGACDYLLKDRLGRLRQAVQSAHDNSQRMGRELRGQRLELLGELVIGIAHDLRNVLGVIMAATEVLRPTLANSPNERVLDVMLTSSRRAEEMLRQMLCFGRGGEGDGQRRVSAEYLLTEIGAILRGTFPSNIRLLIRTTSGIAEVSCDETQ